MVEIDHGNGIATRYGHLSSIAVQDGQTVDAGTVLGRIGSSGRATGPHLHYEVRIDDEAVDPARFLRAGREACRRRLVDVLDAGRAAALNALRQRGLHEGVEIAVEHVAGRARDVTPVRRSFTS